MTKRERIVIEEISDPVTGETTVRISVPWAVPDALSHEQQKNLQEAVVYIHDALRSEDDPAVVAPGTIEIEVVGREPEEAGTT